MTAVTVVSGSGPLLNMELRRSKWLKLDPIVKWTTLRDCQRGAAKLFDFPLEWKRRKANYSGTGGLPGMLLPSPADGSATIPLVVDETLSHVVAGGVGTSLAFWLRALQDAQDTIARNKAPYAEMQRKGFKLEAWTYPTRHVERLVDPHTKGFMLINENDEASRFGCGIASTAMLSVELYHGVQPTLFNSGSGDRLLLPHPSDRAIWFGLMKAFTGVLSGAYIHERVVDLCTDSPLVADCVRLVFGHLIQEKYLELKVLAPSEIRQQVESVTKDMGTNDNNTSGGAADSSSPPESSITQHQKTPSAPTSWRVPQPNEAPNALTLHAPRKDGRPSHLLACMGHESGVFNNTWVILPSAGSGTHSTKEDQHQKPPGILSDKETSPNESSASKGGSAGGSEWTASRLNQLARYLVDHDASLVYVDRSWEQDGTLGSLKEQVSNWRTVNGKDIGRPITFNAIDDLVHNFPSCVRTHLLSLFVPPSQQNQRLMKRVNDGAPGGGRAAVVGVNCDALDAFSNYPHVQFSNFIGNFHRYHGVEQSIIQRHFHSWGAFNGTGSGLPWKERREVGGPGKDGCGTLHKDILFQERLSAFWLQPYVVTAIPMLSAKYLGL